MQYRFSKCNDDLSYLPKPLLDFRLGLSVVARNSETNPFWSWSFSRRVRLS